jgi:hypothetical protein
VPSIEPDIKAAGRRLAELFGVGSDQVRIEANMSAGDREVDGIASVGFLGFVLELKSSGDGASATRGITRLQHARAHFPGHLMLLVVPYMEPAGRERCKAEHISWLDLSGNADITGPGVRILVEGKPNRFIRRGRPSSVFAPKSSRVARTLLEADGPLHQHELVRLTGLSDGFVSRIVSRLAESGLVAREAGGALSVPDRALLLDTWRDAYDFQKHDVRRFNAAARAGDALVRSLADALTKQHFGATATGLVAAWLLTEFAGYRTVTFYVDRAPDATELVELGLHEGENGNVWLVVPNDSGVLQGAKDQAGVRCVHPLQVWLDLKGHGERASEAAGALKRQLLGGSMP